MNYHWTLEAETSGWNSHGLSRMTITREYILYRMINTGDLSLRAYRPWGHEENNDHGYLDGAYRRAIKDYDRLIPGVIDNPEGYVGHR